MPEPAVGCRRDRQLWRIAVVALLGVLAGFGWFLALTERPTFAQFLVHMRGRAACPLHPGETDPDPLRHGQMLSVPGERIAADME